MMRELAHESLNRCLAESYHLCPAENRVTHLFITQRLRRKTALSLRQFTGTMNVRLPYLDKDVVACALNVPSAIRIGDQIQTQILARTLAAFNRVPNANTGARLGATWVEDRYAALRMRLCAKLHLKGYQPYQRLRVWLQEPLRPLIERLLLTDQFADRGICKPEGVRTIMRDHFENRADHTWLLLVLMTLELGQQQLSQHEIMD